VLLRYAQLSYPCVPDEMFGRSGPFVLEIGFGNGGFLEELSKSRPHWNLLGVEKAMASVSRAYARLSRAGRSNVRLVHGNARWVLRDVIAPASLERVYVSFPDPWPKPGQQRHRLVQRSFLELLSTRLRPEGELLFTSDHEEYFSFVLDAARRCELFEIELQPPAPEFLQTKYARRWLRQSKHIQQVALRRRAAAQASSCRTEVVPMYHILMEGSLDHVAELSRDTLEHAEGKLMLRDGYRALSGDRMLFTVLAVEPETDMRQDLLVEVRPSEGGMVVALSHFGSPVITRLSRESVRLVANWLETQGWKTLQEAY